MAAAHKRKLNANSLVWDSDYCGSSYDREVQQHTRGIHALKWIFPISLSMALDIPKSYGAILLGGLYASLWVTTSTSLVINVWKLNFCSLSGFVFVQVVVYFKLYPEDPLQIKTLVSPLFHDIKFPSTKSKVLVIWWVSRIGNSRLSQNSLITRHCWSSIRLLDSCHTSFIWFSLWGYLINDYGNSMAINDIRWYGRPFLES